MTDFVGTYSREYIIQSLSVAPEYGCERLLDVIMRQYFSAVTRLIRRLCSASVPDSGYQVIGDVLETANPPCAHRRLWTPGLGLAFDFTRSTCPEERSLGLVQLLLVALHHSCRINIYGSGKLLVGPTLLCVSKGDSLEVRVNPSATKIKVASRKKALARASSQIGWKMGGDFELSGVIEESPRTHLDVPDIEVVWGEDLDLNIYSPQYKTAGASLTNNAARHEFGCALERLRSYSPRYFNWVHYAINFLVLSQARSGETSHGSNQNRPGSVYLTYPQKEVYWPLALVHEASHQYYHLLRFLFPLENGNDRNVYYSPTKRMARPIDRILLAYHASANMFLFAKDALQVVSGAERSYYLEFATELCEELKSYEEAIRKTHGLTETGVYIGALLQAQTSRSIS